MSVVAAEGITARQSTNISFRMTARFKPSSGLCEVILIGIPDVMHVTQDHYFPRYPSVQRAHAGRVPSALKRASTCPHEETLTACTENRCSNNVGIDLKVELY
ncbi:hypothetical protein BaRGS_00036803 [Batillaria attramentaria]|uniref:Uncharacterized protein n=1 Tax=Batillaria attramentaria TaxID=370345 RepID=A0ABD0JAJ1_9CAEN